jgi:glutamyl-tRNA synthetase
MTAEEVYEKVLAWAKSFDTEFATELESDADFAKKILAIGRGGKKPRKDIATWVDVKPYMGFFYDKYFEMIDAYTEGFDKEDIKKTLVSFLETYDANDEMNVWFDKIKKIAEDLGFASDMKAYKANPEAFKGNVADISSFIRVAVTGKQNAPDLYTVMQILGEEKTRARIENAINAL